VNLSVAQTECHTQCLLDSQLCPIQQSHAFTSNPSTLVKAYAAWREGERRSSCIACTHSLTYPPTHSHTHTHTHTHTLRRTLHGATVRDGRRALSGHTLDSIPTRGSKTRCAFRCGTSRLSPNSRPQRQQAPHCNKSFPHSLSSLSVFTHTPNSLSSAALLTPDTRSLRSHFLSSLTLTPHSRPSFSARTLFTRYAEELLTQILSCFVVYRTTTLEDLYVQLPSLSSTS
jgi:hypothetical protein